MDKTPAAIIELLEARRELASRMLKGFPAGAFDKPHTAEDVAYCEAEVAECDAELTRLRNGQRPRGEKRSADPIAGQFESPRTSARDR